MFIKSFKMFESSSPITISDIIKRKKEIQEKWELQVWARTNLIAAYTKEEQKVLGTIVDIFAYVDDGWKPRGVYNLHTKEFILFYNGLHNLLKRDKYIKIPSENFFDKIDDIYYRLYNDV